MLSLDQIKSALADRKITAVSAATGLHANTIRAIRRGLNDNPSLKTMRVLSDYLKRGV
mgnify:CR=1 FL=1